MAEGRKPIRKVIVRRCLVGVGISYVLIVVVAALFQRSLIYSPARSVRIDTARAGWAEGQVHALTIATHDGLILNGWHISAGLRPHTNLATSDEQLAERGPLLLFFSGKGGHRGHRTADFTLLDELDADIFAFDYRGYGENAGQPHEQALAADALAIWNYAVETRHVDPARIVIYGESLGGGVATRLAATLCAAGTPPGGLILCATFSTLADAGAYRFPVLPVRLLLTERFPSQELIPNIVCPILQMHGDQDWHVPHALGRRLFQAAPNTSSNGTPKHFVTLANAGHNNILKTSQTKYREAVQQFLAKVHDATSAVCE